MTTETVSVVGSKEELHPPKKIRRALGLRPGMKVKYTLEGRKLVVEPIPSLEDLLKMEPTVEISLKEIHDHRRKLSARLEGTTRASHANGLSIPRH
jgi:bifunctional DNA-binding transcriptional regulator/antitoxin component of YhaV-PrlF toxin-antitoxin module